MASPAPIGVQLYSLREKLQTDLRGTIGRLAEIGYLGVEAFGLDVGNVWQQARVFQSYGLAVPGVHSKLPLGDDQSEVLDVMSAVGCQTLVCPWMAPEEFQSESGVRRVCDQLNEALAVCQSRGLSLAYHNHWAEFAIVPGTGRLAHDLMREYLDPAIVFEVDTYWVKTARQDPAAVVRELGARAPLLHLKDGPAVNTTDPMVAVGSGTLDFPAIVSASGGYAQWVIVELDRCATDVLEAVARSCAYLTGEGLGRGR